MDQEKKKRIDIDARVPGKPFVKEADKLAKKEEPKTISPDSKLKGFYDFMNKDIVITGIDFSLIKGFSVALVRLPLIPIKWVTKPFVK